MFRKLLLFSFLLTFFAVGLAVAQIDQPNLPDGKTHAQVIQALQQGKLNEVRQRGLAVFSTPFHTADGLGDGPFDPAETDTRAFGMRPTLQGNGTFLRVNGLDAQSCNECHTIVSNAFNPPVLGFAGVGGAVQNAIIMPSLIDVADSADDRVSFVAGHDPSLPLVFDGEADYNGRFANPPFLFGGGGVELLGKEMTMDLQALLDVAQTSPAGTVVNLDTHGVNFGFITSLGGGDVNLDDVEGIGFTPEKNEECADHIGCSPEDVLVVRPFGRKGENFSMRDFDRGAMQFHFGMQPVEVVGAGVDADGDGVVDEVTIGEMSALHVFDVTNPRPKMDSLTQQAENGFGHFVSLGCSGCHIPVIETYGQTVPLAHPEVADDPTANVYANIDLKKAGFKAGPNGGVLVPLFADLKRHNMGPGLEEDFEFGEIPNTDFTTARLWGIADTAPYIHDGRATTLFEAIEAHGGEAQSIRDAFLALSETDQREVLAFLGSLRVPDKPNESLVP
ncbi:MAG TPA: di-heme oxidoredictase family protein [Acidobacteriota bacterium]|nr:di-heme oxidoredictase family protein [Acidobacteriota bacterium]